MKKAEELSDTIVIDLPDNLTIATAESLHQILESTVEKHQDVVFNAENVNRVDTAGLQLLYAFCIEQKQHQLSVQWRSVTASLAEGADLIGIGKALYLA